MLDVPKGMMKVKGVEGILASTIIVASGIFRGIKLLWIADLLNIHGFSFRRC